ncbi:GNAT family N-acetyltransferase [Microvirga sp. STS02]|uniref:GNAT family N-acetyltransferase n=1 Tax=Hymenobacter negativus TaxID=2795026 RepID=UPI0018DE2147|nr:MULTISPECIES: N-acetyltransferase [Bacteria]MBH8567748.1 GNAT family N-acetyltransferase [Hymenobacter negativus]MBR7207482.1 GNAT family N-acetyltransferase [Microvirga sp. STS02]
MVAENVITIRPSTPADAPAVRALYQRVARESGGIARQADEVTDDYVQHFLHQAHAQGVGLVAERGGQIIAEIHTYAAGLRIFAHVLGDLTVAVDASAQGAGVGRRLFESLLATVQTKFPQVSRVELTVRESNVRAIALYEKLGFRQEGRFEGRVAGMHGLEADIPMAWHAPPPTQVLQTS